MSEAKLRAAYKRWLTIPAIRDEFREAIADQAEGGWSKVEIARFLSELAEAEGETEWSKQRLYEFEQGGQG